MNKKLLLFTLCWIAPTSCLLAQPPGPQGEGGPAAAVNRVLSLDKNKDGKLTEDEFSDSRLRPLLERADADKDKVVTKEELATLMAAENRNRGEGGPGGPGGRGEFGGERGGRGGRGMGPMMRPGTILPDFIVNQLNATPEQREALAKLQASVDAELAKILTPEQKEQLNSIGQGGGPGMRDRRPPGEQPQGDRPPGDQPRAPRPEGERGGSDRDRN